MWIFCGGMYRSASTLQYQIIAQLTENQNTGQRIGWIKPGQFNDIKKKYDTKNNTPNDTPSLFKILKTHHCTPDIAEEFARNNARGLYIHRDIRDVLVSLAQKEKKTVDDLMEGRMIKDGIENYYAWTRLPNVYVSRYEDVVTNLRGEITGIADFFNIPLPNHRLENMAAHLSLKGQQQTIRRVTEQHTYVRVGKKRNKTLDPVSLLHLNHIHDARVGKWQDSLTESQIRRVNSLYGQWLTETGYEA